jgi:hypothetical protein
MYTEFTQRTRLRVRHGLQLISWTSEKKQGRLSEDIEASELQLNS